MREVSFDKWEFETNGTLDPFESRLLTAAHLGEIITCATEGSSFGTKVTIKFSSPAPTTGGNEGKQSPLSGQ